MAKQPVRSAAQSAQKKPASPAPARAERGGDAISGSIGSNAQGAAIGKNIIVIGTLKIPVLPFIILILIVIAAAAFFGLRLLGPASMSGSFNLAVAQFGQAGASGRVSASPQGALISQHLYEGLKIELDSLSPADRANFQPQVWQDSLPITQKRTRLGVIPGDSAQARWANACSLAQKIHADVVIYGNLPASGSQGDFIPEFAICNNTNLRVDADEIVGAHQVIQGLSTQLIQQMGSQDANLAVNIQINAWSNTLSLFSIGVMYDLQGRPDLAIKVLQQARDQVSATSGSGAEVLWFFIGREDLTLATQDAQKPAANVDREARLADAEAAFKEALQINAGYARAHIGLGGVYFSLAESQASADRLAHPELAHAIQEYQAALAGAAASPGALIDVKARLSLASAWILQGEAQRDQGKLADAKDTFTQAIQAVTTSLQTVKDAKQYRLLAQSYLTLGEAYHEQGHLAVLQNDKTTAQVLFTKASADYGLCIQQKESAITDQTLANTIIAGYCIPYKKVVDTSLSDLNQK